jgi:hypothetical protein
VPWCARRARRRRRVRSPAVPSAPARPGRDPFGAGRGTRCRARRVA